MKVVVMVASMLMFLCMIISPDGVIKIIHWISELIGFETSNSTNQTEDSISISASEHLNFIATIITAVVPVLILYFSHKKSDENLRKGLKQQDKTLLWQYKIQNLNKLQQLMSDNIEIFRQSEDFYNIASLMHEVRIFLQHKEKEKQDRFVTKIIITRQNIERTKELIDIQFFKNKQYFESSSKESDDNVGYLILFKRITTEYDAFLTSLLTICEIVYTSQINPPNIRNVVLINTKKNLIYFNNKYSETNSNYIKKLIDSTDKMRILAESLCDDALINTEIFEQMIVLMNILLESYDNYCDEYKPNEELKDKAIKLLSYEDELLQNFFKNNME